MKGEFKQLKARNNERRQPGKNTHTVGNLLVSSAALWAAGSDVSHTLEVCLDETRLPRRYCWAAIYAKKAAYIVGFCAGREVWQTGPTVSEDVYRTIYRKKKRIFMGNK